MDQCALCPSEYFALSSEGVIGTSSDLPARWCKPSRKINSGPFLEFFQGRQKQMRDLLRGERVH